MQANLNVAHSAKAPSRLLWFVLGGCAGTAVTIMCVLVFALAAVGVNAANGTSQQSTSLNTNKADRAQVARLARLIAVPLVPLDAQDQALNQPQLFARLATNISEADSIAAQSNTISPIATEYASTLRELDRILKEESIPLESLTKAGTGVIRASVNDSDQELFLALLCGLDAVSEVNTYIARFETLHTRLVACRLRLAAIACELPITTSIPGSQIVQGEFRERGIDFGVSADALHLVNLAKVSLSQVCVITELTGARGETFSNLYYIEQWAPGAQIQARCRSESPARETVRNVATVRFQVLAAEATTQQAQMAR